MNSSSVILQALAVLVRSLGGNISFIASVASKCGKVGEEDGQANQQPSS